MSGTENSPTSTLEEICASAPASRQPTGRAYSRPCPRSHRTCLDGNTTRSTSRCR